MSEQRAFDFSFYNSAKFFANVKPKTMIVGYTRVSVDEDGSSYCSIINQKSIIEERIRKEFPDSEYMFIEDDNQSGYKFNRPGFANLMTLIENGACKTIIVKDLSRLGRHNALTQLFIEQCKGDGIRVIALDDYDSTKESDDIILGIKTWSNERTVKDASAKVKRVITHKQQDGTWLCAVPFGYRIENDYQGNKIVIDEKSAKTVRSIFDMYLSGMGLKKISIYLTENKVQTSSERYVELNAERGRSVKRRPSSNWRVSVIQMILKNDFYIGTFRTGKYTRKSINGNDKRIDTSEQHVFPNHHEPIIDKEVFDKVQEMISFKNTSCYRGVRKRENLFSGICKCADCGAPMYCNWNKTVKPQYVCGTHHRLNKAACTRHMIREKTLIDVAIGYLKIMRNKCSDSIALIDKEVKKATRTLAINKVEREKIEARIEAIQRSLVISEEKRIEQLIENPERKDAIDLIFNGIFDKKMEEVEQLKQKLNKLSLDEPSIQNAAKAAKTALDIIDNIIATKSLTRSDVLALFEKIIVHEDGDVDVFLKPDINGLFSGELEIIDKTRNQPEKVYRAKNNNVVLSPDGLRTTLLDAMFFMDGMTQLASKLSRPNS